MSLEKVARDASGDAINKNSSNGLDLVSLTQGEHKPAFLAGIESTGTNLNFNNPILTFQETAPPAGDKLRAQANPDVGALDLNAAELYAKASQLYSSPDKVISAIASDFLGHQQDFTPQPEPSHFISPIAMDADNWKQLTVPKTLKDILI